MAENTGGVSFKVGVIHASRPGFAQVVFPDLDGLVSAWLPVVVRKSLKDKECFTPDPGEHVACVLDENFENGVVLGAVYLLTRTPVPSAASPAVGPRTDARVKDAAAASPERETP